MPHYDFLAHFNLLSGGDVPFTSLSVRTFVWFVWLCIILMIATYAANLIAFLTVTKVTLPVNSLEELVAQNEYSAGVTGSSAHQLIFEVRSLA